MKNKTLKQCKRTKCPYYTMTFVSGKCEKCEWNPNAVWTENKKGKGM